MITPSYGGYGPPVAVTSTQMLPDPRVSKLELELEQARKVIQEQNVQIAQKNLQIHNSGTVFQQIEIALMGLPPPDKAHMVSFVKFKVKNILKDVNSPLSGTDADVITVMAWRSRQGKDWRIDGWIDCWGSGRELGGMTFNHLAKGNEPVLMLHANPDLPGTQITMSKMCDAVLVDCRYREERDCEDEKEKKGMDEEWKKRYFDYQTILRANTLNQNAQRDQH